MIAGQITYPDLADSVFVFYIIIYIIQSPFLLRLSDINHLEVLSKLDH